ncbi:hypothetical protein [Amycolatopsis aidingensis]|uniref:hypothetical protein n=1 Tax=Amycolatopsis aidingensis TaxID=2842453 RepID=UPI001C0E7E31|nr:hypothetical protein [Amycolatopsis aidingensis]
MSFRRRVLATAGAVLVAASAIAAGAAPATAETWGTIVSTSWAYTDIRQPFTSFVDQDADAPVGARVEAGYHSSKAYFTFDLAPLRGARVLSAEAFGEEKAANDCTKPRSTQLWTVAEQDQDPTWLRAPREQTLLPGPGAPEDECLWSRVEWDVKAQLAQALAAGSDSLTFVLRMPEGKQYDPAYGRSYANKLSITYEINRPPNVPAEGAVGIQECAQGPLYNADTRPSLRARLVDPDRDWMTATFAIWPTGEPSQRTELTTSGIPSGSVARATVPADYLRDGQSYTWSVRAEDETDASGWMPECGFTNDFTRPGEAPGISSADYPEGSGPPGHGGAGIPGTFTLAPNGVSDVVGYYLDYTYVAADEPGGGATVSYTPQYAGPVSVNVYSVDRAGNRSPSRRYSFWVADTGPRIACPREIGVGLPAECTLTATEPDAASFTYQVGDGPETTVPAVDQAATIEVVASDVGSLTLRAWSTSAEGVRSGFRTETLRARDSPKVHSEVYPENEKGGGPGIPGEFVFEPGRTDVASYWYRLDGGEKVDVPAGPDGTATVTITPETSGFHDIEVASVSADGQRSRSTASYFFNVAAPAD